MFDVHIDFKSDVARKLIAGAFDESILWCDRNGLHDTEADHLKLSWSDFCRVILNKRRYFFDRPSKASLKSYNSNKFQNPTEILNVVALHLAKFKVFKKIKKDSIIIRAQKFKNEEKIIGSIERFGVPPAEISIKSHNRLNASGIPIFYGAFNNECLEKELFLKAGEILKTSSFITYKNILVLDLTALPKYSIFDDRTYLEREVIKFLIYFRREITKPVSRDGREHYEYIPSQVFSEFLQFGIKEKIYGIVYPSQFSASQKNIGLFISNEEIVPDDGSAEKHHVLGFLGLDGSE
ncbi:MAG: HEPN-associated N-terminal domain-containing protein [Pseudobdellovibrio sp.]